MGQDKTGRFFLRQGRVVLRQHFIFGAEHSRFATDNRRKMIFQTRANFSRHTNGVTPAQWRNTRFNRTALVGSQVINPESAALQPAIETNKMDARIIGFSLG